MNEWTEAESRVELAQRFYEQGQWADAARELRAAIDVNPYNAAWHFNLGLALDALGEYQTACAAYEQAMAMNGEDVETLNCLGVDLTRIERYAEALETFEQIAEIDPRFEPGYCNRIVTYVEMGDHANAEVMFYLARQISDECPLCYFNIGTSFYIRGRHARAIDCWRQTLRLDPDYPQVRARIAEAWWAAGDLERAREYYAAEIRHDDNAETLLDYGELLMELGENDDAGEIFRRVLQAEPDHVGALFCLGELAYQRRDWSEAEQQFRTVLQIDGDFPGAGLRLGELLLRRRLRSEATRYLLVELKVSGEDLETLAEVGELLIEARQPRYANFVLRRVARMSPNSAKAQHNLAVSYFLLRRMDEGIRHCRRALKLQPDYPLALYNLALAHMQAGSLSRARRYASRAITYSPDDRRLRELCQQLNERGLWSRVRNRLAPPRCRPPIRH